MSRFQRTILATTGLLGALIGVAFVFEAAFEPGNLIRGLGYLAGGASFLWVSLRLYRRIHLASL